MTAQRISPAVSERIKIARIICIAALVYVHVPPFTLDQTSFAALTPFDWTWLALREGFSRSSVPLLSILSGILFSATLARDSSHYGTIIRKKAWTLLVPLVLWNLIAAILNIVAGDLPPAGPLEWISRLTGFDGKTPLITPTYFLRDLFLCIATYPLYRRAIEARPATVLAIVTALILANAFKLLLITPEILLFFLFGLAIGNGRFEGWRLPKLPVVVVLHFGVALAATLWAAVIMTADHIPFPHADLFDHVLRLMQRSSGALLFWSLASLLFQTRLGATAARFEPFVFFYFCAHALALNIIWRGVTMFIDVPFGSPLHQLFFFSAPLLLAVLLIPAAQIAAYVAPQLMKLLCGGRVPMLGAAPTATPGSSAASTT